MTCSACSSISICHFSSSKNSRKLIRKFGIRVNSSGFWMFCCFVATLKVSFQIFFQRHEGDKKCWSNFLNLAGRVQDVHHITTWKIWWSFAFVSFPTGSWDLILGFYLIFIKLHLSLDSSSWTTVTTWHMCTGQVTTGIPLLSWHEISHPMCTAIVMCGSLGTMGKASPTLRTCSRCLVAATHMHESTCFIHLLWTTAGLVDNTICSLHLEMTSVLFVCLLFFFFHDHLWKLGKNLNSLHKKLNSWAISYYVHTRAQFLKRPETFRVT